MEAYTYSSHTSDDESVPPQVTMRIPSASLNNVAQPLPAMTSVPDVSGSNLDHDTIILKAAGLSSFSASPDSVGTIGCL